MLRTLSVALLAATPSTLAAFSNTFSLLAWSESADANLESFRPFAGKGSQDYQIKLAQASPEDCMPTLVVSAPTFSHDDLALLPSTSTVRQSWTNALTQLHLPYLGTPSADNLKSLISRRLGNCNPEDVVFARVRPPTKNNLDAKARWMQDLNSIIEANLDRFSQPVTVILSSVTDLGHHYRQKRQLSDADWEELEQESEGVADIGVNDPLAVEQLNQADAQDTSGRPLSVFEQNGTSPNATVDPSLGLLHRYTFTSPNLIFATLVTLLALIPAVMFSINALTSIELFKGLESGKMIGGQLGADSKKDS